MRLNYKSLLLTVAFLIATHCVFAVDPWDGTYTKWTNGSGTQTDPYLIETPSNLAYLVRVGGYKGFYFLQTADFDINNQQLVDPAYTNKKNFYGNYDGGNHQITNVASYLFGAVNGASIQNVTIAGSSTYSMIKTAQGNTTLTNCHNKSTAKISSAGLVVTAEKGCLSMYKCSNSAVINGVYSYSVSHNDSYQLSCAGGLVANAGKVKIEKCTNNANITIQEMQFPYERNTVLYISGLIGHTDTAYIIGSCNNGSVTGNKKFINQRCTSYCSGIVGGSDASSYGVGDFEIVLCFNSGNIISHGEYASGIGQCSTYGGALVSKCYSRGTISSSAASRYSYVYGISSRKPSTDCYFAGMLGKNGAERSKNLYYQVDNDGAIPKTEEMMKSPSFVSLLNVDGDYFFPDYTNINDGYPVFRWQLDGVDFYNIKGLCREEQGTITGAGAYPKGAEIQLTATPKDNFAFAGWSDGVTDNPRTVKVEGEATYVAQFERTSYTVYVNQDCSITVE